MALRQDIKPKFETNDIPSQLDFYEVFDSFVHKDEEKATAAMVDAGTDDEHYVTPALLRYSLQNIGTIGGGGNLPYKQNVDDFNGTFIGLDKLPIESSVKVFKNGQLLQEEEDYTINYETAVITFSAVVEDRNIEIDYWYKSLNPIPGNGTNYVDLTTNQTVGGNKTFTGTTTLSVAGISGRESILTGKVDDNSLDMFQIANGTNVSGRFVPTFIGYTNGDYGAMAFRGLGSSANDLSNTAPYIKFLAANTNNSADPNNGTLSSPMNRDLFTWGSVEDHMRMKADGRVLIGNPSDDLSSKLQVSGAIKSNNFVKSGATSDDVLLGDGSTISLSSFATPSDFKTINGESIVGEGNIEISGGGSQSVFAYNSVQTNVITLNNRISSNYVDLSVASSLKSNMIDLSFSDVPGSNNGTSRNNAIALGFNIKSGGNRSIVIGTSSSSTDLDSVLIGNFSTVGAYAVTIGCNNTSISNQSVLIGNNNNLNQGHGISIGEYNVCNSNGNLGTAYIAPVILGRNNTYSPQTNVNAFRGGILIGDYNTSTSTLSNAIGQYLYTKTVGSTVIGRYNTNYTPVVNPTTEYAISPTDRMFIVGIGTNNSTRADGLIILRDGTTTAPSQTNTTIMTDTSGKALVTKEYIDTIVRPYKVYTALLSQSGTDAPTAIVLENTLGGTIVWTRGSSAEYYGTLSGAFIANKTAILITNGIIQNTTPTASRYDNNSVSIVTLDDDQITYATVEIRVYS